MSTQEAPPETRCLGFSPSFVITLVCLALFAGSVLLYAPSIGFGFVGYDDTTVLLEHPNLYAQATVWSSLHEILRGYFPREEPLLVRDVSWLLDARLFGFRNPVGYHLGNVLLNAADVVLLLLLLLHITRCKRLAILAATLFAALSVHVEPVCWIMGRKDLLSAFFVLLALLVQSIQLRHSNRRVRWLLAALVFLLYPLAVLSKFSAIILVLVLAAHRLLAPYLDGRRAPGQPFSMAEWPRALLGLLPHMLAGVAMYRWYQRILTEYQIVGGFGPPALSATHLGNLAVLVPQSLADSLTRIFSTTEHSISYLRPNVAITPSGAELASGFAVLLGLLALVVLLVRYRKDLVFFPVAFILFLLPYFNFEYVGIWAADRDSYLASLGVVALLAAAIALGLRSSRVAVRRFAWAGVLTLAVLAGHHVSAGRRHQVAFRDRESLWTYEKNLSRPSILSFERYANLMLIKAEAAKEGSPQRRTLLEVADAAAREGLQYFRAIPWKPAPGYVGRERIQAAGLFTVLGTASELAGGTLEQQLALHRAAYQLSPADRQTEMLAGTLFALATRPPRDLDRARESLRHFRDHFQFASRDRLELPRLHAQLRAYRDAFPELATEVTAIETEGPR